MVRVLSRSSGTTYVSSMAVAGLLVGQALPAAADADDLVAELVGAVGDALDDAVEAGDVAAPGEDADAWFLGHDSLVFPSAGRTSPHPVLVISAVGCVERWYRLSRTGTMVPRHRTVRHL